MQRSTRNRLVRHPSGVASWLACAVLIWIPVWGLAAEAVEEQAEGVAASEQPAEAVRGPRESIEHSPPTLTSAGLRAYIDPETGELTSTPTAAQLEVFTKSSAPSLEFSSEGLETFPLQRGGRGVRIEGRFLSALKVRRHADGSLEVFCEDADHDATAAGGDVAAGGPPAEAADSHDHPAPAQPQWAVQ